MYSKTSGWSSVFGACLAACLLLPAITARAADADAPVQGLNCVFFAPRVPHKGEMSLAGIHKRLPEVAEKAGITGHSQVELTYDSDPDKMAAQIKEALSGKRVDLLGLTVSLKTLGKLAQFVPIMDQAVTMNPNIQFVIQSPGPVNIPVRKFTKFRHSADLFHKRVYEGLVKNLRNRYPSNRIICANYGRAGAELKNRFEDGDLPGIPTLVGEQGVFRTEAGAPGPILDDLHAMLTLSLIYDIDLRERDLGLGYKADMGAILKPVLKFEARHRPPPLEPFRGEGPNIFSEETWEPPWGYTVPVTGGNGVNAVLWGHKFFGPLVEAIAPIAAKGGITNHKVKAIVHGPVYNGAPGVGAESLTSGGLKDTFDTGAVDLVCLTYHQQDTGKLIHYRQWMDYARARNPKVRLLVHLPSSYDPARRDPRILNEANDALRARFYASVILPLRKAYPDNEIIFWFSGNVNAEMRRRFEQGELPQVTQYIGPRGIFAVPGGYPGPLLQDLEGLILYSLIYKVDLPKTMTDPEGKLDLNALATEMLAMEAAKGL